MEAKSDKMKNLLFLLNSKANFDIFDFQKVPNVDWKMIQEVIL